ncbi:MAG TPA: ester cyclase [Ferruginibacter sp.]|nr:ester cyclase [Ferruginibacter sp.]
MKKILFALIVPSAILFISCNNEGGQSATTKKNLDAMHGVINAFDTKDFSKLGDYIAEDAVDHAGQTGDIKGLANMKAEFEKMSATNDNAKTVIIKELADDEYVMSWLHFTGTLKVDQPGMGKAGDKYDMKAVELAKFKDGKAIEHWSFVEPAEMMKMMGGMQPAMQDPVKIDTVKKM